ncbi:MAG: glycoside hydrolase family 1 protein [Candidatus Sungbacteria bacterium]|nr:glycoside hydrolase family 1 protein [Candidatus Sungbacteria bacterium]
MSDNFRFPKNFLWGAATSAHQVEGGNHNDWSEWESANAERLAAEAEKNFGHLAVWPMIREQATRPENYISGAACDHYHRFREDFDIAKSLGHNAHRFSIEWSRIEPEEGKFDEKEIEHYREVIAALRERGMEPFVTLWHYTLPVWFLARGGWLAGDAQEIFIRFVLRMVDEYKNDVTFWCIYNEPETYARHGYLQGNRPPEVKNIITSYRVLRKLAHIYGECYLHIKKSVPRLQVGFSETIVYFEPYNQLPHNILFMKLIKWWRNNPFLSLYIAHSDFIGLQYYFHSRIRFNPWKSRYWFQCNENKSVNDLGWEVYPEGMYHVLKELGAWKKPIFITENGIADARDTLRTDFIKNHISFVQKAMSEGADVAGYFHWSLLDNFEWNLGFWPRFGLVAVDYENALERKIRPSAYEYKKIIEQA